MGKNKHQKIKNIFKVAGAKSLKPKSKAKVVKGQLKQIALKNKSKISEVDQQLVNIQDKVRQNGTQAKQTSNIRKVVPIKTIGEEIHQKFQVKSDETLQNLNDMQL